MRSDVPPISPIKSAPRWNTDDEIIHIEDTLRSESLALGFEHLIEGCTCKGKICHRCRQEKCCQAFSRDRRKHDGLHWNCLDCQRIIGRAYRRDHPDAVRAFKHNARARKVQLPATLTEQQWSDLKARYHYRCLCCGKQEPEITLTPDHVIPLSKGGPSSIENIQSLCLSCNQKKASQIIDFRSSRSASS